MDYGLQKQAHYLQIAEILRKEILSKSVGERIESDNALARKFTVSVSVIREALSILTRDGLVTRHVGKGTFVAPNTKEKHVALLFDIDFTHSRSSLHLLAILREIRNQMDGAKISHQVYLGKQNPTEIQSQLSATALLENVKTGSVSAVISIFSVPHLEWTAVLKDYGVPIIGLGDYFPEGITQSRGPAIEEAVDRLARQGRTDIALISWVSENSLSGGGSYVDAFRASMGRRGLPVRDEWLKYLQQPSIPGVGWEHFRDIWTGTSKRPNGLVITDDILFQDASLAVIESGVRVPEQLLVVAMVGDAMPILHSFKTTCLEYSTREIAEKLMHLLERRLSHPAAEPLQITFGYRVIESSRFFLSPSELLRPNQNTHHTS